MKKLAIAAAVMLTVAGCASAKIWQATGGSRSDDIVKLSYQYGMFERPELSDDA